MKADKKGRLVLIHGLVSPDPGEDGLKNYRIAYYAPDMKCAVFETTDKKLIAVRLTARTGRIPIGDYLDSVDLSKICRPSELYKLSWAVYKRYGFVKVIVFCPRVKDPIRQVQLLWADKNEMQKNKY